MMFSSSSGNSSANESEKEYSSSSLSLLSSTSSSSITSAGEVSSESYSDQKPTRKNNSQSNKFGSYSSDINLQSDSPESNTTNSNSSNSSRYYSSTFASDTSSEKISRKEKKKRKTDKSTEKKKIKKKKKKENQKKKKKRKNRGASFGVGISALPKKYKKGNHNWENKTKNMYEADIREGDKKKKKKNNPNKKKKKKKRKKKKKAYILWLNHKKSPKGDIIKILKGDRIIVKYFFDESQAKKSTRNIQYNCLITSNHHYKNKIHQEIKLPLIIYPYTNKKKSISKKINVKNT
ncbi:hypothetical protein M0812_17962 [Anaeramoeba flamelloides]|uniref:Uncharacterized protein n=1 Tax=Anaeramoeba flamelloides TaxID=1746091 RepID=A0AAV7Z4A0_9EUKA|nr:hypothetical protein M0812_17962 [Anaeramoeba flamelloides]